MTQHKQRPTTTATRDSARELHRNQTPAEKRLWSRLRSKQLHGLKFRRQRPIGQCIVDFCCISHRLVVEIDGDSHASQEAYDQARTAWLETRGYKVCRFTNREVTHQVDAVLEAIARECDVDL